MEMESTQSTESTTTSPESASVDSSAQSTTESSSAPTEQLGHHDTQSAAAAPVVEYTPNWKFKANGQEHEIDEEYRGYVKTPEDEKRIKRMFEQFKGVEKLVEDHKTVRSQTSEYQKRLENYDMSFKAFDQLINSGQESKALTQLLKLKPQHIYAAAKQLMDFDELPQQAKDLQAQNQRQEEAIAHYYQQQQQLESERNLLRTERLQNELDRTLASPEVSSIAQAYDGAHGPRSFYELVKQEGQYLAKMNGQDPTAVEVVQRVVGRLKPFMSQPQTQAAPQAPKAVPVIPATGSGSRGSPSGATQVRSIEDLQKAYQRKIAERQ